MKRHDPWTTWKFGFYLFCNGGKVSASSNPNCIPIKNPISAIPSLKSHRDIREACSMSTMVWSWVVPARKHLQEFDRLIPHRSVVGIVVKVLLHDLIEHVLRGVTRISDVDCHARDCSSGGRPGTRISDRENRAEQERPRAPLLARFTRPGPCLNSLAFFERRGVYVVHLGGSRVCREMTCSSG